MGDTAKCHKSDRHLYPATSERLVGSWGRRPCGKKPKRRIEKGRECGLRKLRAEGSAVTISELESPAGGGGGGGGTGGKEAAGTRCLDTNIKDRWSPRTRGAGLSGERDRSQTRRGIANTKVARGLVEGEGISLRKKKKR